ncbi:MAG: histidinol dehydrogenase [Treponema sp.]|jgi:histidinol dehydrogenase|nr:histidinol dehydrogenase [Treponema sp.]
MRIIGEEQFDSYWKNRAGNSGDPFVENIVRDIIADLRSEGDSALRRYTERFDRVSLRQFEVPFEKARAARGTLVKEEPELASALELAAAHIRRFADLQCSQITDFETEMSPGLFTGQRVIPVERAAIYVPGGRFPLFSSVLMGVIPALAAGVGEVVLASPPVENGVPDKHILAALAIAASVPPAGPPETEKMPGFDKTRISGTRSLWGFSPNDKENAQFCAFSTLQAPMPRIFAIGGAQAIAALAIGTETVPKVDLIAGPGNKYVAAAKRMLFGEVGIDFVAGPTDVLVVSDTDTDADLAAADMLAQAEHDPDARARALVPSQGMAEKIAAALETRLARLPEQPGRIARASLDSGGLIVVCRSKESAIRIANVIAPEHLELQTENTEAWIPFLKNYGSLFIGSLSAEVLGDYSAGINHTLPTSGNARFSGGLSVRHFLKIVTTLRCAPGEGFENARKAAEIIGGAEGLAAHARSAAARRELS